MAQLYIFIDSIADSTRVKKCNIIAYFRSFFCKSNILFDIFLAISIHIFDKPSHYEAEATQSDPESAISEYISA